MQIAVELEGGRTCVLLSPFWGVFPGIKVLISWTYMDYILSVTRVGKCGGRKGVKMSFLDLDEN